MDIYFDDPNYKIKLDILLLVYTKEQIINILNIIKDNTNDYFNISITIDTLLRYKNLSYSDLIYFSILYCNELNIIYNKNKI
jgi:hypothetical protein